MEQQEINKIVELGNSIIKKIENKESKILFYTFDTKNKPLTSIKYTYDCVKYLVQLGYNAFIFHEKDYVGVKDWLGVEYSNLPHKTFEQKSLKVDSSDIIIIPEMAAPIMKMLGSDSKIPCKKIVICQSYEFITELLIPGDSWVMYGFDEVIVTSKKLGDYVKTLFPTIKYDVIPIGIDDELFNNTSEPKTPNIAVLCRNSVDFKNITKLFYLKQPLFRWITFKHLDKLKPTDYAKIIKESALVVWLDEIAGFGTTPIEALKCGTNVLAKVPNLIPEWALDENNELIKDVQWFYNNLDLPNLIGDYIMKFTQDTFVESDEISKKYASIYTPEQQKEAVKNVFGEIFTKQTEKINKEIEKIKSVNEK